MAHLAERMKRLVNLGGLGKIAIENRLDAK
jgi:hypothetical protein